MKAFILIFIYLVTVPLFSQTAQEFFDSGYEKQMKMNIIGAVEDYSAAIDADPDFIIAYFNRGLCLLTKDNFDDAIEDFEDIIEIDPNHKESYYQLSVISIKIQEYEDAREYIDKAISLDSKLPNALTLRGQLKVASGDLEGACEDFAMGVQNSDQGANNLQSKYCSEENLKTETFGLDWTGYEDWKLGDKQKSEHSYVYDYIKEDEEIEHWTELINSNNTPLNQKIPMYYMINLMKEQVSSKSETSEFEVLEVDSLAENAWVIFTVENNTSPEFPTPESQLWYIIQGKKGVYLNFWTNRKDSITDEEIEEWSAFFKRSYFTYE